MVLIPRNEAALQPYVLHMWGLSTEGNLLFKIDWASLIVERKFTLFAFFWIWGQFPSTGPGRGGGLYLEGRFNRGFFALWVSGLIFEGAYTWKGLFSEFYGTIQGCRLIQQVGGESNTEGFLLVQVFFCFPTKVAQGHTHSRRGKAPGS